jgi:hypothetical protein
MYILYIFPHELHTLVASFLYPQRLAITSPTSGGRSVGIARLQTKATEFSLVLYLLSEQHKYHNSNKMNSTKINPFEISIEKKSVR